MKGQVMRGTVPADDELVARGRRIGRYDRLKLSERTPIAEFDRIAGAFDAPAEEAVGRDAPDRRPTDEFVAASYPMEAELGFDPRDGAGDPIDDGHHGGDAVSRSASAVGALLSGSEAAERSGTTDPLEVLTEIVEIADMREPGKGAPAADHHGDSQRFPIVDEQGDPAVPIPMAVIRISRQSGSIAVASSSSVEDATPAVDAYSFQMASLPGDRFRTVASLTRPGDRAASEREVSGASVPPFVYETTEGPVSIVDPSVAASLPGAFLAAPSRETFILNMLDRTVPHRETDLVLAVSLGAWLQDAAGYGSVPPESILDSGSNEFAEVGLDGKPLKGWGWDCAVKPSLPRRVLPVRANRGVVERLDNLVRPDYRIGRVAIYPSVLAASLDIASQAGAPVACVEFCDGYCNLAVALDGVTWDLGRCGVLHIGDVKAHVAGLIVDRVPVPRVTVADLPEIFIDRAIADGEVRILGERIDLAGPIDDMLQRVRFHIDAFIRNRLGAGVDLAAVYMMGDPGCFGFPKLFAHQRVDDSGSHGSDILMESVARLARRERQSEFGGA